MQSVEGLFNGMRRRPDIEAANLHAVDAADRLLLDVAAEALATTTPGGVAVIGDNFGALTLGLAVQHGISDIRVHQDPLTGVLALAANAADAGSSDCYRSLRLGEELLTGATVVLMRLPRGLAELSEIADAVARYASKDVTVFAGGRDKHLTLAMNGVLGQVFASVTPSLGRQKSRVLVAKDPKSLGIEPFPVTEVITDLGLTVVAHGAAFSGAKLDIGTRFLLDFVPRMRDADLVVDLGCGTGILAVALARHRPDAAVVATDQSAAAVASAIATADANGVGDRVQVVRDDAMASIADGTVDLIVCNPPFHLGAAVHTGAAVKMFEAAGRVLRPGGELWTVYNAHLNYRGMLQRLVGRTDVVGRNRKFTVARSISNGRRLTH